MLDVRVFHTFRVRAMVAPAAFAVSSWECSALEERGSRRCYPDLMLIPLVKGVVVEPAL